MNSKVVCNPCFRENEGNWPRKEELEFLVKIAKKNAGNVLEFEKAVCGGTNAEYPFGIGSMVYGLRASDHMRFLGYRDLKEFWVIANRKGDDKPVNVGKKT